MRQRFRAILLEVLPHLVKNKLPVRCWWSAECSDRIAMQDVECALAIEGTTIIVYEESCSAIPSTEERPSSLRPACRRRDKYGGTICADSLIVLTLLSQDPIELAWLEPVEVFPSDRMRERVGYLVVADHLRVACRTRSAGVASI
jgi:hypothetical protein